MSSKPLIVTVIVPAHNEEAAIGPALADMPWELVHEVIVADIGSRDLTVQRSREAGARVIQAGAGYGRACYEGAIAAGDDCEILVFMDGDGADSAAAIPELIAPIVSGEQDFVIGSRLLGRREPGSMGIQQIAAGYAVGGLLRLLYGVGYTDMCAFRAIRRSSLLELGMREMGDGWNLEMQMRAARIGLRIREIPVASKRLADGESKLAGNLKGGLRASRSILTTLARVAMD